MDPITQGTLGAAAAAMVFPKLKRFRTKPFTFAKIAWMGALGGMAADLDVLIRSASDPLLAIEYHRHFTHSLVFIPVGGAISALPWLALRRYRARSRDVLLVSTLGYATHGLLDACTTYGTLLLWPFSTHRVSWGIVSVVDPLFTLPLLAALVLAVRRQSPRWLHAGLLCASLYLAWGWVQRERALSAQTRMAAERGHVIERSAVFPQFLNNVTWRSLYQSAGEYSVDKIRVPWFGKACVSPGVRVPVVDSQPLADPGEARAHRLLRWFASGWVAQDPDDPRVLGDLRYSFSPQEATPIWGILDRHQEHARGQALDPYQPRWVNNRGKRDITWSDLRRSLFENSADARCF